MSGLGSGLVPDDAVRSLTEQELGALREAEGAAVADGGGHRWASIFPGFFQPVNLVARLPAEELRRPTLRCWGYRAALVTADADRANGSVPVHLLEGLDRLDPARMTHGRIQDLRRCRGRVEIALCRDPSVFEEHGYRVYASAQDRLHYWADMTEETYRRVMRARVADTRRLFVVGFVDGVPGGYLEAYIVDGVIHVRELIVATDVLKTGISTGLYVDTIELALGTGSARDACLGLDTPERPGLTRFKESLGFPVVHLPAHSSIPRPIGAFIRARRPEAYYRLTGMAPGRPPDGPVA